MNEEMNGNDHGDEHGKRSVVVQVENGHHDKIDYVFKVVVMAMLL